MVSVLGGRGPGALRLHSHSLARMVATAAAAPHVAVLGGGWTGLACAHGLLERGMIPTVFDMGGLLGGRASSKALEGAAVDMGAQFIALGPGGTEPRFSQRLASWVDAGDS